MNSVLWWISPTCIPMSDFLFELCTSITTQRSEPEANTSIWNFQRKQRQFHTNTLLWLMSHPSLSDNNENNHRGNKDQDITDSSLQSVWLQICKKLCESCISTANSKPVHPVGVVSTTPITIIHVWHMTTKTGWVKNSLTTLSTPESMFEFLVSPSLLFENKQKPDGGWWDVNAMIVVQHKPLGNSYSRFSDSGIS